MRELSAEATGVASQPIASVFAQLRDLESYPAWHPDVVQSVEVVTRDQDGVPSTVDAALAVALGPVHLTKRMRMAVSAEPSTLVSLERVPDARGEHEPFTIVWQLAELGPDRTQVTVRMSARLELPPFLPVGQIGRQLAQGFLDAALRRLA